MIYGNMHTYTYKLLGNPGKLRARIYPKLLLRRYHEQVISASYYDDNPAPCLSNLANQDAQEVPSTRHTAQRFGKVQQDMQIPDTLASSQPERSWKRLHLSYNRR